MTLLTIALFLLLATSQAEAQTGVAVAVEGNAIKNQRTPLKVQDGLVRNDTIDTADKSLARLLLNGKATLTVKELSRFTITEEQNRAVINLSSGAILLSVARHLMAPGEEIQVRTPRAVAAVKGSTLYVETGAILTTMLQAFGESAIDCLTPLRNCPPTLTPATGLDVTQAGSRAYGIDVQRLSIVAATFRMRKAIRTENRDAALKAAAEEAEKESIEIASTSTQWRSITPALPAQPGVVPHIVKPTENRPDPEPKPKPDRDHRRRRHYPRGYH